MIIAEKDTVTIELENADDYLLTVDQLEYFYDQIASVTYSLTAARFPLSMGGILVSGTVSKFFIGEVK
jgi:NAD+ kinase